MSPRRHRSAPETRVVAAEHAVPLSKTVELEIRVARLEAALSEARDKLDAVTARQVALQARLDHLSARLTI